MSVDCVFCKIVAGQAPATVVATSDAALAIVPLNPVVEGHVIVLPRHHVAYATTDPELTGEVMTLAATLAQRHHAANIITSIGAEATQTVFHLHIHVVPRRDGDGLCLPWTGQMNTLPGAHSAKNARQAGAPNTQESGENLMVGNNPRHSEAGGRDA